ncbi:MAG: hypothetical protein F7C36_01815 [Desulfurococcales archaeon]|nr:hypothetical protein [Desulfurococcales archaeon]
MPRKGIFMEKIVEAVARIASEMIEPKDYTTPILAKHTIEAVRNVGVYLRPERLDAIYCELCGKGPFTRKGYYLHLIRVHSSEIQSLVEEEAERILKQLK